MCSPLSSSQVNNARKLFPSCIIILLQKKVGLPSLANDGNEGISLYPRWRNKMYLFIYYILQLLYQQLLAEKKLFTLELHTLKKLSKLMGDWVQVGYRRRENLPFYCIRRQETRSGARSSKPHTDSLSYGDRIK